MRLYYLIGGLLRPMRLAYFYVYNVIFQTPRARVLIWNENDEVLLVRNWAGQSYWALPGGGVKRKERPIGAAKRELYEELGLKLPLQEFVYVATLQDQYTAWIYTVTILKDDVSLTPHNPWEITDLQWFSPKKLPADLSPLVPHALMNLSKSD
ncbi:MAG: ADP-ribose pyrophosphatase [Candidatus Saccharibacteria bacterium]|jgi:8-oxo-dGTP pyrophosphatase MutT (NUDIX family)|nr:ADP-ribose pyrophosphatase [Candidatus Saccharibacteria bacterium]